MTKADLSALVARMNAPWEEGVTTSSDTTRWKAHREAETITDPGIFPLLRELTAEQEGKRTAQKEARQAIYFIYGRVLERAFTPADCAFLLQRLDVETDKNILHQLLERIKDLHDRAGILLPPELDTTPVCRLAQSGQSLVRHSALHALAACPGPESREVLAFYLAREDEKKYKYEMWYANIAMQSIGQPEDIPLLERFLKSRRQDLKITARYAIQYINERARKAPKEVTP